MLDPNTNEWQDLARDVEYELENLYKQSVLSDSFMGVEVEAFRYASNYSVATLKFFLFQMVLSIPPSHFLNTFPDLS